MHSGNISDAQRSLAIRMEAATELKNKGNDAFKNKDWPTAIDFYTQAIEKYDKEPSFYTNRAQVRSSKL